MAVIKATKDALRINSEKVEGVVFVLDSLSTEGRIELRNKIVEVEDSLIDTVKLTAELISIEDLEIDLGDGAAPKKITRLDQLISLSTWNNSIQDLFDEGLTIFAEAVSGESEKKTQ